MKSRKTLRGYHPLTVKRKISKHGKRVESLKGGKSKERQLWNYLIERRTLDRHLRQRSE